MYIHEDTIIIANCTLNPKVGDKPIKQVNEAKLRGIIIDESIFWDKYIYKMCNKISKKLGLLKRLKKCIPSNTLLMLFNSLALSHFDYANVVWGIACGTQIKYVYKLQKRAAGILTGANRFSQTKPLFKKLNWMSLTEMIEYHTAVLTYKARPPIHNFQIFNCCRPAWTCNLLSTIFCSQGSPTKFRMLEKKLTIGEQLCGTAYNHALGMLKAGYCRSVLG